MRAPRARCQLSRGRAAASSLITGSRTYRFDRISGRFVPIPPLSPGPESFHFPCGKLTPSVGCAALSPTSAFQSVLNARSFCLRDSGAVAPSAVPASGTLSRASTAANRRDGSAVEGQPDGVNRSARRVVAQLVRGQLKAEQHLEAGAVHGGPDGGIRHRADRGVGGAGAALPGDLAADIVRPGRG